MLILKKLSHVREINNYGNFGLGAKSVDLNFKRRIASVYSAIKRFNTYNENRLKIQIFEDNVSLAAAKTQSRQQNAVAPQASALDRESHIAEVAQIAKNP